MIWEQLQSAKRSKSDLHIVWLDLANAFGSVPHQLITYVLYFFQIPSLIQDLVGNCFNNLYVCYTTWNSSTDWHWLKKGIAMGCAIFSSIFFTTAFEEVLIGRRQMVRGVTSQKGQRLPAVWSEMDDINSLLQPATCTSRLLKCLEELLAWACEEEPVKRLYMADLSDKTMATTASTQLQSGPHKIDQCFLPGKFKVWCLQFTLYRRLLWPLKLSDITLTAVLKLEAKANNFIWKWLGLPRCFSTSALFGRNT